MKDISTNINRVTFPNLFKILDEYYKDFKTHYIDNLKKSDRVATGNFINNINCDIEIDGRIIDVNLELLPYWQWLEDGRQPTKNKGDGQVKINIKKWILSKKIALPQKMTLDQLTYLITRKIHEVGYGGSHDIKKTINEVNNKWINRIQFAFEQDCKNNIYNLIFL